MEFKKFDEFSKEEKTVKQDTPKVDPVVENTVEKSQFKKFNEFEFDTDATNEDDQILEALDFLDESILADIKKFGLWKSLKRLGTRVLTGVSDIIKANPKIKEMLGDGVKEYGKEFAQDASQILGEYEKTWQEKEAAWKEREKDLEKDVKDAKRKKR